MKFSHKNIRFIIAIIFAPVIVGLIWFHESNKKINIAHNFFNSSLQTNTLRIFTDNIELETNNEINFQTSKIEEVLWPASRLSELAETGEVDISIFLLSSFSPDFTPFDASNLPFVTQNYELAKALWVVNESYIKKKLAEKNLRALFIIPQAPQGLFLKQPLEKIQDLKKLKIRVFDKVGYSFIEKMGFTPVILEKHEMKKAIEFGYVDGSLGGKPDFYDFNFIDILPHYYDLKIMLPKYVAVMNQKSFEKLPDEKQQAILKNADFTNSISWRFSMADEHKKTMIMKRKYNKLPAWFIKKAEQVSVEIIAEWIEATSENRDLLKNYKRYLKENHINPPKILNKISGLL